WKNVVALQYQRWHEGLAHDVRRGWQAIRRRGGRLCILMLRPSLFLNLCRMDDHTMTNDLSQGMMSRRTLLLGAAMSSAWQAFARENSETTLNTAAADTSTGDPEKLKICVFSK